MGKLIVLVIEVRMADLFIPVLLGTTREKRRSVRPAKFIVDYLSSKDGVTSKLVDPKDLNLPGDGNDPEGKDPAYTEITEKADAFVVVVPEYNHSFPGSLKRMLDSELKNYIHKPVNLVGVSSGRFGGVRAIESLVPVLRELGMAVTFADLMVTGSKDAFDENNQPTDETFKERLDDAIDELVWYATTLKHGRENLPNKYHQSE